VTAIRCGVAALVACSLWPAAATAADDLDSLFDLDKPLAPAEPSGSGLRWSGYAEAGAAYTYEEPAHWSKLRARFELAANGKLGERAKFKLSGRVDADGAYDLEEGHYPGRVRRDQRREFSLREAYIDTSAGDWEFRFGRQHVVWGEVVGIFLADVVSARDMREFFLPEFEALRIPQWAARAEYFGENSYLELLWIPVPSYDEVGKPGADFYPFPLPPDARVHERKPANSIENTNWGVRATHLINGWDLSAFYYRSLDVSPTLYRISPAPTFELRHDRIRQVGGTVSKDLGAFVLKGEAVHTHGRSMNTADPTAPFGLKASNTFDYIVGVDIPVADRWRFNIQHYGHVISSHEAAMGVERHERGLTLLVNRKFGDDVEAEVLLASSIEHKDYMVRPKVAWRVTPDWRAQIGVDLFGGGQNGLFGRFANRDRVYMELRRWF